jgi:hypothetical protein
MSRSLLSRLAFAALVVTGLAACSDQPAAPKLTPHAKVTITGISDFETYQVVDFTVDSKGGTFNVGPHYVKFPPNSICDPAKSSYGPTEWDTPCQTIKDPITIHAEIQKSADGLPAIRFSPDLRFAPPTRKNTSQWVYLYMVADEFTNATSPDAVENLLKKYSILWSPAAGLPGIDESVTDATLKTYIIPEYSVMYRRVKHFSGYQVGSGTTGGEEQF